MTGEGITVRNQGAKALAISGAMKLCGSTIIGITGFSGSGKDTVAALLAMRGFTRYAFADELREEVRNVISLLLYGAEHGAGGHEDAYLEVYGKEIVEAIYAYELLPEMVYAKPAPPLMRQLLQRHGTEFRRTQDPNYWVSKLMEKIDNSDAALMALYGGANSDFVSISDVRFANEADAIRERGGKIWRVTRPNAHAPDGILHHISESGQSEIVADETLVNDGTVYDLALKVRGLSSREVPF